MYDVRFGSRFGVGVQMNACERALRDLPVVHAIIFEPQYTPAPSTGVRKGRVPRMTPGRAALVGLMDRYLRGLLDPFVSLLEVRKLMYFMQEAGEPLKLRFAKAPLGPYAENLRHVLHAVEGHYVSGYGAGGDAPAKILELIPGAVRDAQATLREQPDTQQRFNRVAQLVEGFESPFGLELLATVHWILVHDHPLSDEELVDRTFSWADRKRQFSPNQIRLAGRLLKERGWIAA